MASSYTGADENVTSVLKKYIKTASAIPPYSKEKVQSKLLVRKGDMWQELKELQHNLNFKKLQWQRCCKKVAQDFDMSDDDKGDYKIMVAGRLKAMAHHIQQADSKSPKRRWAMKLPWNVESKGSKKMKKPAAGKSGKADGQDSDENDDNGPEDEEEEDEEEDEEQEDEEEEEDSELEDSEEEEEESIRDAELESGEAPDKKPSTAKSGVTTQKRPAKQMPKAASSEVKNQKTEAWPLAVQLAKKALEVRMPDIETEAIPKSKKSKKLVPAPSSSTRVWYDRELSMAIREKSYDGGTGVRTTRTSNVYADKNMSTLHAVAEFEDGEKHVVTNIGIEEIKDKTDKNIIGLGSTATTRRR